MAIYLILYCLIGVAFTSFVVIQEIREAGIENMSFSHPLNIAFKCFLWAFFWPWTMPMYIQERKNG